MYILHTVPNKDYPPHPPLHIEIQVAFSFLERKQRQSRATQSCQDSLDAGCRVPPKLDTVKYP